MLICFDGACEPRNPGGHMGWGMAVVEGDVAVEAESGYQEAGPTNSNNVAEYLGMCMALRRAIAAARAGEQEITIRGDSKMVIEQLNERMKARTGHYMQAMQEAKTLLAELRSLCASVSVEWMPGSENVHADEASRAELEKRGIERWRPGAGRSTEAADRARAPSRARRAPGTTGGVKRRPTGARRRPE